jgi:pimeloyl-ACP methyl ester carboxylesterase
MAGKRLRDMIVLLPGITGSVLRRNGKDVWAISGQAASQALTSLGKSFKNLRLDGPGADGVVATRVMPDAHLVPGLVKIDGYSAIANMIRANFNVVESPLDGSGPANFIEFPYDWRLDNRINARALANLIERRLKRWQEFSFDPDARVIFVAHSMGGLVARYYLEVLEGWRTCRALITFGTPYRGSLNALNYLCNGYKEMFVDLTDAMRTFPAVYQLLPIYHAVRIEDNYVRVAETASLPGVDMGLARDALAFHREIEDRVAVHQKDEQYRIGGYTVMPMVGVRQPTMQSGTLVGGHMSVSAVLPSGIDELLGDGDGTVPRASAIPIEMTKGYAASFVAERHGSLQCNPSVLDDVRGRLEQLQVVGLGEIRGPSESGIGLERPSLSLDVDDLYTAAEKAVIRVRTMGGERDATNIVADITSVSASAKNVAAAPSPAKVDDGWQFDLSYLPPGLYRIHARCVDEGPQSPTPVQDLFEIAG